MIWNDHSKQVPEGAHAFLGASKYSWLNYDESKLVEVYSNMLAKEKGTELHAIACSLIKNGIKLPQSKKTLNQYVNDAIGFRMIPEQVLYYSSNCFGTADTIAYNEKKKFLRIHDYKSGKIPASLHQLEIYTSLFCLEYNIKPGELSGIELRIYQNNDILIGNPEADDILPIMDKIVTFDKILERIKEESEQWL
ncbi:MAG: hypothetical protein J6S67_07835 [Methanobrevibacter sp.]|nr:hypothetical protein [Methanobrevibacter sp.]